MNRLYRLLAFGYFPKELPPIFRSRSFARHSFSLSPIEDYVEDRWQRPTPFLLQQKAHYRRRLDILAPSAILGQASIIANNYADIKSHYCVFPGDCSRPAFNRKTKFQRAVRPFALGRSYSHRKLELRSRFPIVLKLDIKNFYRSVYTHSIPWAIHGKEYAKTHLREKILGNNLDKAFQRGQDGQTIGIPTGPDTSFIIAELILSRILQSMIDRADVRSDRIVRYYDDIEYGCESDVEAHRILARFEAALREYELEVNPEKVSIISGPKAVETPWLYRLREFEWQDEKNADELLEIFSHVAEIAGSYPEDHVFRYFLVKMRTTLVAEDAWPVYQRILLTLFQEGRGNAREIFNQFSYYKAIHWPIDKSAVKEALDRKVRHQVNCGCTSELTWAIYGYILFGLNISKSLLRAILKNGDGPSRVLAAKIIYSRKIALKSEINSLVRSWGEDALNSSEWLFAYEVMVNKWHDPRVSVKLPSNRRLFEHLRNNSVSFLDDNAIAEVDLPRPFKDKLGAPDEMEEENDDWLANLLPSALEQAETDEGEEDDEVFDDDLPYG